MCALYCLAAAELELKVPADPILTSLWDDDACVHGGRCGYAGKLPPVTQLFLKARVPSLLTVEQPMQEPPVHVASWLVNALQAELSLT